LDNSTVSNLSLQESTLPAAAGARVLVVGEVLWDQFPDSARLGGAALNFAVHLKRLGHTPRLLSAVGADPLGEKTRAMIAALGLDTSALQSTSLFPTGTACVHVGPDDEPSFAIARPAAYDAIDLYDADMRALVRWDPAWLYFGTLYPSLPQGRRVLRRLFDAVPGAIRLYDMNLRPGVESPELVKELLGRADLVKLNERELRFAHEHLQLPLDPESFCRIGARRYGWTAACITFGARGCAMLVGDDYSVASGVHVDTGDPVGAGDAFAAAFTHGVASGWPSAGVATFANRVGASVAASRGAIPAEGGA
jgi:fructokinase